MFQIDNTDYGIIDLLMEDGRMSASEIARRVGNISERAVRYRIDRLVKQELIQVTAVVNPRKAGFSVVADVWLEVESEALQSVAEKMTKYECISYVAYSIGDRDVSVQVIARDNSEVYNFVTEVIGKTPGVRKTTTSIVPRVLKDVHHWRLPASVLENPEK